MSATSSWKFDLDPVVQERLLSACERCERLPVMDRSVQRVLALTADDESGTSELVSALEGDPDLAANILRYANSAHASRPIRAKTVRQAVVMVGRRAIRQLCLEAVTFRFFESAPGNGRVSRGQLHLHAISVANIAAAAARLSGASPEAPHLAGLLHDCGKLIMPLAFGEDAMDELAAVNPSGVARSELEWDRFGVDHAYAGALLAEQAGLEEGSLVAAIAWHHGGRRGCAAPSVHIACLQLADAVVGMLAGELPDQPLLCETLSRLGLDESALDTLAASATQRPVEPASPAGELSARLAKLEALVGIDELTGLANRRAWMTRVKEAISGGEEGRVMLVDLDHFKHINDTHGHPTGDLVLCEVARVLDLHGVAGRIGGDEFALWTPGQSGPQAAQRVVAAVAERFTDGELDVAVSVGLAPAGITSLTEAIEAADKALYAAKAAGRGRACVA